MVRQLGAEKEIEKANVEAAKEEERRHVEEELAAIQAENARVQVGKSFSPHPMWLFKSSGSTCLEHISERVDTSYCLTSCWVMVNACTCAADLI